MDSSVSVRLLRSGDFKEKLAGFDNQFKQQRDQLHFLLGVREAGQVQRIDQAVAQIISTLGQPTTSKEVQAAQIINHSGGELGVMEVRACPPVFRCVLVTSRGSRGWYRLSAIERGRAKPNCQIAWRKNYPSHSRNATS
jgi:hypothetical protein